MEVKTRAYTIDDVWEMLCQPGGDDRYLELINGELIEMAPPNSIHAWLAPEISRLISNYAIPRKLGFTLSEGGFSPADDRSTLLAPDIAFVRTERMPIPFPKPFFDFMPDLAIEVKSPSNSYPELRRKARIYLSSGATLVWIIDREQQSAEVWRVDEDGGFESETVTIQGVLRGEGVLPGFELPMHELLPPESAYF